MKQGCEQHGRRQIQAVAAGAIGNFIELFDFIMFGFFALEISANFFPARSPLISILSVFATYGVGFIMRPLGAVFFGSYGDKKGRRQVLILTVGLMAVTTGVIGILPVYADIGVGAPILLVMLRLLQGFSAGGEWGGAATFLVEYADPGERGRIGSLHQCSAALALAASTLFAAFLQTVIPSATMFAWGWRIPFLVAFVLAPVALYLRSQALVETPSFLVESRHHQIPRAPVREALTLHWRRILTAFAISAAGTASNYMFLIFFPTFAIQNFHISPRSTYYATALCATAMALVTPLSGRLSDHVGRRPPMLVGIGGQVLLAWPLFRMVIDSHDLTGFICGQFVAAVLLGISAGPLVPLLTELFPTTIRLTGLSIGYGLSVTIFGGFGPFIGTLLISWTGRLDAAAFYVVGAGMLSFITLLTLSEPAGLPFADDATDDTDAPVMAAD